MVKRAAIWGFITAGLAFPQAQVNPYPRPLVPSISSSGGSTIILENNGSVVSGGPMSTQNLLPGSNMSWTTSCTTGVCGITPVISGFTTAAQIQAGQLLALTTTSSSTTTYTAIMGLNDPLAAYAANQSFVWNVGSTACAGGAMTLNIDSLGAISLYAGPTGTTNLTSAQCGANAVVPLIYDAVTPAFRLPLVTPSSISDFTVAVSSGSQGSNSCSSATTQTVSGLTTSSVLIPGYSASPATLTGWGSTGGMVFQTWPSAANTLSWIVCNQTTSSISYSAITFNVGVR